MTAPRALLAAAAAALLAIAAGTSAQPARTSAGLAFDESHETSLDANPPALSLTIRAMGDRQQFAMGELVTLELTFANHGDGAYTFNPIGYDRSGRLGIDRVHVSPPEQTSDPLRDYYRGMLFGFVGGGISAIPSLLREPRTLQLRVNEWVRFEQPGEYRLFVTSGRLENDALDRHDPARRVRLVSNMIAIQVVDRDEPHWSHTSCVLRPRQAVTCCRRNSRQTHRVVRLSWTRSHAPGRISCRRMSRSPLSITPVPAWRQARQARWP